jgi:hypothetical protein
VTVRVSVAAPLLSEKCANFWLKNRSKGLADKFETSKQESKIVESNMITQFK